MAETVMALQTRFLKNTEIPSIGKDPLFPLLHAPAVTVNAIARDCQKLVKLEN